LRIDRLVLTAFRNYRHLIWQPERSITVLTGENGAGKTNLLEAVSLLAPGRGLRGAGMTQLPCDGASQWGIAARLHDATELGTGSDPNGSPRRAFRLNGAPVRTQAEIARVFACVWSTPQMDQLFSESASGRRRFLDRLVVALAPTHARETAAHDRSVAQRNRMLIERPHETGWLRAIEDSIARHAVSVTAARIALTDEMNAVEAAHPGFPRSLMRLDCDIAAWLRTRPALAVEDHLRALLEAHRTEDAMRGGTSLGAHKADLHLTDHASGRTAERSSSGQQKAMLLGLVLAHASLIASAQGSAPVLLLDEPLLHLDMHRRDSLLEALRDSTSTVLLTGTDPEPFAPLHGHADFQRLEAARLRPFSPP